MVSRATVSAFHRGLEIIFKLLSETTYHIGFLQQRSSQSNPWTLRASDRQARGNEDAKQTDLHPEPSLMMTR